MTHLRKYLWLCLAVFLPLATTHTAHTAEVIYVPAKDLYELWQGNVDNPRNARLLFRHTHEIEELAVQADGKYILFVAGVGEDRTFAFDAFLIERDKLQAKAHNLTSKRFDVVWDIDISHKGDVVFTNYPTGIVPEPPYGVYFIAHQNLKHAFPKAELLFEREAYEVTWAPDGVHIAFQVVGGGIYLYNTQYRGGASVIDEHGYNPAFSPEGKRLALVHKVLGKGAAISVISLPQLRRRLKTIALDPDVNLIDFKWMPDGQALIYTVRGPDKLYHTYLARLDGGEHQEILKIGELGISRFDWMHTAYPVETRNRLTTLWGKLKTQN